MDQNYKLLKDYKDEVSNLLFEMYKLRSQSQQRVQGKVVPYLDPSIDDIKLELNSLIEKDIDGFESKVFMKNEYFTLYDPDNKRIEIDRPYLALKFTTDDITLKDIHLGRFEAMIEIWSPVKDHIPYFEYSINFEALDPNPAKGHEGTTHPNIQNGNMCFGEFDGTLHFIMNEGRFFDLYELVNNLLNTVSESPYIHIDDWDGFTCKNCGENGLQETDDCNECGDEGCEECIHECSDCRGSVHEGCFTICYDCESRVCNECSTEIDREFLCQGCIGECQSCYENFKYKDINVDGNCEECAKKKHCKDCNEEFTEDELDDHEYCEDCRKIKCSLCLVFKPQYDIEDHVCVNCISREGDVEETNTTSSPAKTSTTSLTVDFIPPIRPVTNGFVDHETMDFCINCKQWFDPMDLINFKCINCNSLLT